MIRARSLFDFYINSSIHVAAAVASFTAITYLHFGIRVNLSIIGFNFFSTIAGYNYIKYRTVLRNLRTGLTAPLKGILIVSISSMMGMLFFARHFTFIEISFVMLLGLISFFYTHPVFILKRDKALRSVTGIKITLIALVWTGASVLLPAIHENLAFSRELWVEIFQRFLMVIVLTLPFDIRDIRVDYREIETVPQLIGIRNTKILSFTFLMLVLTSEFLFPYKDVLTQAMLILILAILAYMTYQLKIYQEKYFASFWVESIPIFWFGALSIILIL